MVKTALAIIFEKSEIHVSDLKDETLLSDVGVDSLIYLMVASTFAEELGITTESIMFMEETTVDDIKRFVLETTPGNTSEGPAETTATVAETQSIHLSTPERHPEVTKPVSTSASVESLQSWDPLAKKPTGQLSFIQSDLGKCRVNSSQAA